MKLSFAPPATSEPSLPRPNAAQLAWARREFEVFVHFGTNTFTDRELGTGDAPASCFNPSALDARQWARIAKSAGAKAMVLTAKHHDGFCLWPSKFTDYSVKASPYKGGKGDIVREFVDACREEGLLPGIYLSPWDRHEPSYGNTPAYNAHYLHQLEELLTQYGDLGEIWFDGACGEGPNGRKQDYDWTAFFGTCARLQPGAVTFGDAGTLVRWVANEDGIAERRNWATIHSSSVRYPGDTGADYGDFAHAKQVEIADALSHGDPRGDVWRQTEVDVSIRPGWFYHAAEDDRVRSSGNLFEIYLASVGRNSTLLLNVPPDKRGLFADADAERMVEFGALLRDAFSKDLASDARHEVDVLKDGRDGVVHTFTLPERRTFSLVELAEPIEHGQTISRHNVLARRTDGRWETIAMEYTIGNRRIESLARPVTTDAIRVELSSFDPAHPPRLSGFALYA